MARFELQSDLPELYAKLQKLPQRGEQIITDTLHNEGAELIKKGIDVLLPRSGRKRKSPIAAASNKRSIMPNKAESGNLNVVVSSTKTYRYLYYPDDGSNTRRHRGEQHFMRRGGESQSDKILKLCIEKLTKEINEN